MKYLNGSGRNRSSFEVLGILVFGLLTLWLIFRNMGKASPQQTINRILQKSQYSDPLIIRGWIAVSRLETGNWTRSPVLFGQYNNGFGMGVPKKRPSTRNGQHFDKNSNMFYSTYTNFADSVRDIILWMDYSKFPGNVISPEDFALQLKSRGYATDPDYQSKIIKLMKQ